MRRLSKEQRDELVAIMEAVRAYAEKYGENYLCCAFCGGSVSVCNSTKVEKEHFDLMWFADGKIIENLRDQHEIIREGAGCRL